MDIKIWQKKGAKKRRLLLSYVRGRIEKWRRRKWEGNISHSFRAMQFHRLKDILRLKIASFLERYDTRAYRPVPWKESGERNVIWRNCGLIRDEARGVGDFSSPSAEFRPSAFFLARRGIDFLEHRVLDLFSLLARKSERVEKRGKVAAV